MKERDAGSAFRRVKAIARGVACVLIFFGCFALPFGLVVAVFPIDLHNREHMWAAVALTLMILGLLRFVVVLAPLFIDLWFRWRHGQPPRERGWTLY